MRWAAVQPAHADGGMREFGWVCVGTRLILMGTFTRAGCCRKKFGVGNLPNSRSGVGWNMNYPFNQGAAVFICS